MMKWLLAAIGAVCFLMVFTSEVVRAEPWVGPAHGPNIVRDTPVDPQELWSCHGTFQTVLVEGLGQVRGCVVTGVMRSLVYHTSYGPRLAVTKSPVGSFFQMKGVCEHTTGCEYAPGGDRLIERVGSPFSQTLRVYDDISKRLTFESELWDGIRRYELQNPDGTVMSDRLGKAVIVGAFALSRNGRWLVAELRNKGTALIDLETKELRRVLAPGYQYDIGMDPAQQLAVSDDGKTIAVTGVNSGFTIASVDDTCGDKPLVPMDLTFRFDITPCVKTDVSIGATPHGFRYGFAPEFSSAARLSVIVSGRTGPYRQLVIQPRSVTPTTPYDYVALGDSFSSGEGETDDTFYLPLTNQAGEKCHTSRRSYPFLLGLGSAVRSVACSGARIHDVVTGAVYLGQHDRLREEPDRFAMTEQALQEFIPGRIPQGDFIEAYTPKRVTIGIGGNDAGMMDKLQACAMPGECRWVNEEGRQQTIVEINRLHPQLTGMYAALREKSPHSQFFVVGYPKIINALSECDAVTGFLFTSAERRYMNEAVIHLNKVIAAAASAAKVPYIDIEQAFTAAALCDEAEQLAMNGFRFGREAGLFTSLPFLHFVGSETFHPTPFGHELVAGHVREALQSLDGCCSVPSELPAPSAYWILEAGPMPVPVLMRQEMATGDAKALTRRIVLPAHSFAPQTPVSIELYSEKLELGRISASTQGAVDHTIVLPPGVEEGFHTLYLYGETDTGESIGYYQTILFDAPEKESTQAVATKIISSEKPASSSVLAAAISPEQQRQGTQHNDAKITSPSKFFHPNWFWLLPVLLLVGIMTVWLVFARR